MTEVVNNTLQIALKDNYHYSLRNSARVTVPITGLLTSIALHDGSDCKLDKSTLQAAAFSISLIDGSAFDGNINTSI